MQRHRLIFDASPPVWVGDAWRFLRRGVLWAYLKGEVASRLLTILRRPQSRLRAPLRLLNIEPTNYCNQKCRFCATGLNQNQRPRGKLDLASFQKIVAAVPPNTSLMLAGFGEPFINEHLEEFLEHAAARGLARQVFLYSNFGTISADRIRRLLDLPFRRLIISLDAMSRETFIEQKGVDEFEQVFENLKILSEAVRTRGSVQQHLVVQMIVTQKTLHERQRFLDAITALKLTPRLKRLNTHSPRLSPEKIKEFEVPELSRYAGQGYTRRCEWVWGGLQVYWNGDVSLCCQDPTGLETYGSIQRSSIPELLNTHPGRGDFRRRYFADPGQIEICRKCDIA